MRATLAIAVTPDYLPGAIVTIHSFLKHNPWFDGPVVCIDCGLEDPDIRRLGDIAPELRLVVPAAQMTVLRSRVADSPGGRRWSNYAKGTALSLTGSEVVLLLDADLLVVGDVRAALTVATPMAAAPDIAQLEGTARSRRDGTISNATRDGALPQSFSSGFVILNEAARGPARHVEFLDLMTGFSARGIPDGLTDQAVFNVMFQSEVTLLDASYNFLLGAVGLMPVAMDAAHVLHFNVAGKPWNPIAALKAESADLPISAAYRLWHAMYREAVAASAAG